MKKVHHVVSWYKKSQIPSKIQHHESQSNKEKISSKKKGYMSPTVSRCFAKKFGIAKGGSLEISMDALSDRPSFPPDSSVFASSALASSFSF